MAFDLNTLRSYLALKPTEGNAVQLQAALDSAVVACEQFTLRHLTASADPVVVWSDDRIVGVPDLRVLTSIDVDGAAVDVDQVELLWSNPHPYLRLPECPAGRVRVEVAGEFGYSPVPADLADSVYVYAARSYRERDAMYADVVDPGDGSAVTFFRQMPPKVRMVWESYKVPDWPIVSVRVLGGG